jgi:hypothetical protein
MMRLLSVAGASHAQPFCLVAEALRADLVADCSLSFLSSDELWSHSAIFNESLSIVALYLTCSAFSLGFVLD